MVQNVDDEFYKRADEHIDLSNKQLENSDRDKVSASMMFSLARFNAWLSATGFQTRENMIEGREQTVEYFVIQYRKMLEENLADYIQNYDRYMGTENNEES